MKSETIINICGKEVGLRYCAAAETGYEQLSGKSSDVFSPTVIKRDADGTPVEVAPPKATENDYIMLAVAAIVAYYAKNGGKEPIKSEDILYDATAQEVTNLMVTIVQLRNEWYKVPSVVKDELEPKAGDEPKNA